MPTKGFVTYIDHSKETSTVSFWLPEITALNFAGVTQDLDEIVDGLAVITQGHVVNKGFTRTYDDDLNLSPVTDESVGREDKWLITFRDVKQFLDLANSIPNPSKGKLFKIEVPTAVYTGFVPQGSDFMTVGSDAWNDLAAALVPNVKSENNRNAPAGVGDTTYVEMVSVKRVGRNL